MNSQKHAVDTMKFAHDMLNKMMDGIPPQNALTQPHSTSNHLLWTLGHLATTYAWFCTMNDPKCAPALPDSYNGLFGMGSKPSGDAAKYPPLAEVRKNYDAAFGAYLKSCEAITDGWAACASDSGGFASSKLDAAYKCAWHDGWHLGQVSDLRRVLGLPSVM